MNERIKELAEQAGLGIIFHLEDMGVDGEVELWKFAELIVAECIEVCRRGKYDGREDMSLIQFNNGIRFCINAIDEHFGD